MKSYLLSLALLFIGGIVVPAAAQPVESMYGDQVKADVKMKYVYTLEDALRRSKAEGKPIFFNCFADWAVPCHGMNKYVFSDPAFAEYMDKNFVNLFIDVSQKEHQHIAQQFGIQQFAHYLVLDAQANVLLRIVGGKRLPEFQSDVMRALSPKTSLRGTEQAYAAGKRGKKELLNYLYALDLGAYDEQYRKVAAEYLALLSPKEYAKAENWKPFTRRIADTQSDLYTYLVEHKSDFVRHNGAARVDAFMESLISKGVVEMATGQSPYEASALMEAYLQMQRAQLPDTALTYQFYQVAKLRGEHRYADLIAYLRAHGQQLQMHRTGIDLTLRLSDATEEEKALLAAYLRERSQQEQGAASKELARLATAVEGKQQGAGIRFESLTFDQALERAKAEGKLVFIDCYTTWCGPCKLMADKVFPLAEVGTAFNPRFVSLKIDMEKGEGPTLAKRYNVSAYPTMLILDAEGNIVRTLVGAMSAQELIAKALAS